MRSTTSPTTAVDQFVEDYLIVMDNDVEAYKGLIATAKEHKNDVWGLSQHLRNEWEEYVDQVAELATQKWGWDAPATLIIRQMLNGWGDNPWHLIAVNYLNKVKELEIHENNR